MTRDTPTQCPAGSTDRWSGAQLAVGFAVAAEWLAAQAERLNALNVYPVPDGDTGTNMSLTMDAAAQAVRGMTATASEVAAVAAHAAVMGSRGNSGVILSQVLAGFARGIDPSAEIGRSEVRAGLAQATRSAYASVVSPAEGTILTAVREAADAVAGIGPGTPPLQALRAALRAAGDAVARSPDLLPLLKETGVVDAGAEGFRLVLEGLVAAAEGRILDPASIPPPVLGALARARSTHETLELGYCTEFIIRDAQLGPGAAQSTFQEFGSSLIVVSEGGALRVHLHTEHPGRALEVALGFGPLDRIKIDNMEHQHRAHLAAEARPKLAIGPISVVAVASGAGFQALYGELGATVVDGGRTMNPSVEQLVAAVRAAPPGAVVILPNNSNVGPVARQAAQLAGRPVSVIDTISPAQGICVMLGLSETGDAAEALERMQAIASRILTIDVVRASRTARIEGIDVREGEYLALRDGLAVASDLDPVHAAVAGLIASDADRFELLTAYRGEHGEHEMLQSLRGAVTARFVSLAFEALEGGQPHHTLTLTLE